VVGSTVTGPSSPLSGTPKYPFAHPSIRPIEAGR
jgi:hypothetical protein